MEEQIRTILQLPEMDRYNPETLRVLEGLEHSMPIAFGAVGSHPAKMLHVPDSLENPESMNFGGIISHPP